MNNIMQTAIHIVLGILERSRQQVLIAKRHHSAHQGGRWEFPGGKVAAQETAQQALTRELAEELGIEVKRARPLIKINHQYPDRQVLLDVWQVQAFSGEPQGREGQPILWVTKEQLGQFDFPAANQPIIRAVQLPQRYVISGPFANQQDFINRFRQALTQGARLIQLRIKSVSLAEYIELASQAVALCRSLGAQLLLNSDSLQGQWQQVKELGAAGVHLTSRHLAKLAQRPLVEQLAEAKDWLVGCSCHQQADLFKAQQIGADFAVLSPVQVSQSHPQAVPLGWISFSQQVAQANLPVYALGGLGEQHLDLAWQAGAQGVAAISAFWLGDAC
jgi:8-oxo-dGTP diphosphatase